MFALIKLFSMVFNNVMHGLPDLFLFISVSHVLLSGYFFVREYSFIRKQNTELSSEPIF